MRNYLIILKLTKLFLQSRVGDMNSDKYDVWEVVTYISFKNVFNQSIWKLKFSSLGVPCNIEYETG